MQLTAEGRGKKDERKEGEGADLSTPRGGEKGTPKRKTQGREKREGDDAQPSTPAKTAAPGGGGWGRGVLSARKREGGKGNAHTYNAGKG